MSGLTLRLEFDSGGLREALARYRDRTLPEARRTAVREGMLAALEAASDATPVDTGRARAAWIHAIEQLGGNPPPGAVGDQHSSVAVTAVASDGNVTRHETASTTEIVASNSVPYVPLLEYGTRGRPPHHMVRAGLQAAKDVVPRALSAALNS